MKNVPSWRYVKIYNSNIFSRNKCLNWNKNEWRYCHLETKFINLSNKFWTLPKCQSQYYPKNLLGLVIYDYVCELLFILLEAFLTIAYCKQVKIKVPGNSTVSGFFSRKS